MIRFICIFLLFFIVSCKAQETMRKEEKRQDTTKPRIKKPKFEDVWDENQQLSPGTVRIKAMITGDVVAGDICGLPKKATVSITVNEVIGMGSSIVNLLYAKQEVIIEVSSHFRDKLVSKGNTTTLLLREKLCQDMSQTYYSVINF